MQACLGSPWPTHPTLQFTSLVPTPQPAGTKEDPDAQYYNRGQYMFVLSPPRTVVAYRKVGCACGTGVWCHGCAALLFPRKAMLCRLPFCGSWDEQVGPGLTGCHHPSASL